MTRQAASPPTPAQFYIELPLYEEVTFSPDHSVEGWLIRYSDAPLDVYCPECGSHSVFTRLLSNVNHAPEAWTYDPLFDVKFICSRNREHKLYFQFKVAGRTMQKIGQFPSLAALNLYDVKKYSGILDKPKFQELTKAIGLAAHGVGVGSFVYLRRIFEMLVEEAHQLARSPEAWIETGEKLDEEEFNKARMAEKIQLLHKHLPSFLVENRSLYGILSKGVHELSEQECLAAFPIVRIGIEIILDAKVEQLSRMKKQEAARKAIQALAENRAW